MLLPFTQGPNMSFTVNPTVASIGGTVPIEEPTAMKFQGFTEQTLTHDIRTYHETEMTPNTFKHDSQNNGQ